MDTKKLRQKILDLAIRGKLVPQDPNDEPASVLLERIRAEKERLIQEGKIKRSKKSASDDEIEAPFEIPESWEWCKLGNIMKLKSGECIRIRSLSDDSKYPVYGGNGINGSYNDYNVEAETLIIGRVGFYCGSIHKTNSKAWVTDNALIVTYNKSLFYVDYLKYALKYLNLSSTSNSTAQPVVSGKGIYPLLIPIPPLVEQQRIINEVERWFTLIDELESNEGDLLKAIDKTKSKILDLAIHGKLVPQDPNDEPASVLLNRIREEKKRLLKEGKLKKKDLEETPISEEEKPFEIPESWEWVRLSSISKTITKGTTPRGGKVAYSAAGIGFLRAENVVGFDKLDLSSMKYVTDEEHKGFLSRSILEANDLLITIAGTLGRTALVRECDLPLNANQAVSLVRLVNAKTLSLLYVIYVLNAPSVQIILTNQKKDTAIPNLTLEIIGDCIIPLPPYAEQLRIVTKIEELFAVLDGIKESLEV